MSAEIPNVISLGAGVQSSALALMAAHGEITPTPIRAVFADTQAEPASVYKWLEQLKGFIAAAPYPFPVQVVTAGNLTKDVLTARPRKDGKGYFVHSGIPAFTVNKKTGAEGIIPRQCTSNYKITVLDKNMRALVGAEKMKAWRKVHKEALASLSIYNKEVAAWRKNNKDIVAFRKTSTFGHEKAQSPLPVRPKWAWDECQSDPLVISWIGISMDEWIRKKESRHSWAKHRHPLIEAEIHRRHCLAWMEKNGYPKPPRSACKYCPYKSDKEWRLLRDNEPEEFAEAVAFDKQFRELKSNSYGVESIPFLHSSRVPLDQVDLSTDTDHGQGELFSGGCEEGMCGT